MADMLERTVAFSGILEDSYNGGPAAETTAFTSSNFLFRNTGIHQIQTDQVDLDELRSSFTKTGFATGRQLQVLTPGFVLMGFGSFAEINNYRLGRIFQMCGMAETTVGVSSLRYRFVSSGFTSGACAVHENAVSGNGLLYTATGVYGTLTMAGSAGQVITVDPTLTGLYAAPVSQAVPTPTNPPDGNTSQTMKSEGLSIAINGGSTITDAAFKSFSLDFGIDIQENKDANAADALAGLLITNRNPRLTVVVGLQSNNAVEYFLNLKTGSDDRHTITFTHGDVYGKRVKFTCIGQLEDLPKAGDAGLRTVSLTYKLIEPDDDEQELTIECF